MGDPLSTNRPDLAATPETHPSATRVQAAAERPPGPGRTVWLASYPKSGNTWMRAIVTALGTHRHLFGVNHLGSGSQPMFVGTAFPAFGIDPRWLSRDEIDRMRTVLVRRWGEPARASRATERWLRQPQPTNPGRFDHSCARPTRCIGTARQAESPSR